MGKALGGFQKFEPQGVAVVKLSSLRPGQKKLYNLIATKIKSGDSITLQEAEQIWCSLVHSNNAADGRPLRWDYYAGRYEENGQVYFRGAIVPMSKDEIQVSVLNWLTKTIGILVIRGYLKVIPMIEVGALTPTKRR